MALTKKQHLLFTNLLYQYSHTGKYDESAFTNIEDGKELKLMFADLLDLFDIDSIMIDDRRLIMSQELCDAVVKAYSQRRPYQDWYIRYGDTLAHLEPKEMELVAARIQMEAMMKRERIRLKEGDGNNQEDKTA